MSTDRERLAMTRRRPIRGRRTRSGDCTPSTAPGDGTLSWVPSPRSRPGVRARSAFVIGLAVDAIFLAERPYALPLVPDELVPGTDVELLYFSIAILLGATAAGAVASWIEAGGGASSPSGSSATSESTPTEPAGSRARLLHRPPHRRPDERPQQRRQRPRNVLRRRTGGATLWILATVFGIGLILVGLNLPLTVVTLLPIQHSPRSLLFTRLIEPRYLSIREEIGDLNSRLENNVSGIASRSSKARAERFETERVAEASGAYLTTNLSAIKVRITYFPGLNVISGIGFAVTFLVGGLWVLGRPVFGLTGR